MSETVKMIEEAAQICGSKRKLAAQLDVSERRLSDWVHGRKPIPADSIALLAAILKKDPMELLAEHKGGRWETARKLAAGAVLTLVLAVPHYAEAHSGFVYYVKSWGRKRPLFGLADSSAW